MSVPILRPPVNPPLHPKDWVRPAGNHEFRVTTHFSDRNAADTRYVHGGTDMGSKQMPGRNVYAPSAGTVIDEGWLGPPWSQFTNADERRRWNGSLTWGGIMVAVRLSDDSIWAASHLEDTVVSKGQILKAGQLVGHVGNTGAAYQYGTHLHNDLYVAAPAQTKVDGYLTKVIAHGVWRRIDMEPHLAQNQTLPPDTGTTPPHQEDTMRYSGADFHVAPNVPIYRLTDNSNFRAGAARNQASLQVIPAGTPIPVAYFVDGEDIGGNAAWALCFLYVNGAYTSGFLHSSLLKAEPAPPSGPSADEVAALVKAGRKAGAQGAADAAATYARAQ